MVASQAGYTRLIFETNCSAKLLYALLTSREWRDIQWSECFTARGSAVGSWDLKDTQDSCVTLFKAQGTSGKRKLKHCQSQDQLCSKMHLLDVAHLQHSQTLQLWFPAQNLYNIGPISISSQIGVGYEVQPLPEGPLAIASCCGRDAMFFSGVVTGRLPWLH